MIYLIDPHLGLEKCPKKCLSLCASLCGIKPLYGVPGPVPI